MEQLLKKYKSYGINLLPAPHKMKHPIIGYEKYHKEKVDNKTYDEWIKEKKFAKQ